MRLLQFWWRTLSMTYNPPELVEHLMVLLTLVLGLTWVFQPFWQYLVLSSSFAMGVAASMWVREVLLPSPRPPMVRVLPVAALLFYSLFAFVSLVDYV